MISILNSLFLEKQRTLRKVCWKNDGVPYVIDKTTTFSGSIGKKKEVELCLFCTYYDNFAREDIFNIQNYLNIMITH